MGTHQRRAQDDPPPAAVLFETVSLQAWHVLDGTNVAVWGSAVQNHARNSYPLAKIFVPYRMLHLPSVGQVLWALGDELRTEGNKQLGL